MNRISFSVLVLVLTVMTSPQLVLGDMHVGGGGGGEEGGDMHKPASCWPGNSTKARCFSSLPQSQGPWPSESTDDTVVNDMKVVDMEEYSVVRMQKSPFDFCQHKEELVEAMQCMTNAMAEQCPKLPQDMLDKPQRLRQAYDNLCDQINDIDAGCMSNHHRAVKDCHEELKSQRGPSSSKPQPGPQPSEPSEPSGTQPTSQPDPQAEAEPKPTQMDGRKMMDPAMQKKMCHITYQVSQCAADKMESCHQQTAVVLAQFMRDMSSADCAAMMDGWDASTGGAIRLSSAVTYFLSSAIILAAYQL